MRAVIAFNWEEVGAVRRSLAGRPDKPRVPAGPGIYRFRVSTGSDTEVYIGESQNLHNRMVRNYSTNHTGTTNVRVRQMLLQHIAEGRDVQLAIVTKAGLEVDGALVPADFSFKEARMLVENAALTLARFAGERIHNL